MMQSADCQDRPRSRPAGISGRALCALIRLYRKVLSPLLPNSCRFYPSCSAYALETLQRQRLGRALWLIASRLVKCQPLHPGGYDPAPKGEERRVKSEGCGPLRQTFGE
jgi:putative membrane protein insertion efficiency factor